MTTTLTIRVSPEKKARVRRAARGKVNQFVNEAIDSALTTPVSVQSKALTPRQIREYWKAHFQRLRENGRVIEGHPEDEMRRKER